MHDEPRTELEQRALAAWTPAEPPADFTDRVLAAAAAPKRAAVPLDLPLVRPRWPRFAVAAIAAAALAGSVAAGVKLWGGDAAPTIDRTETGRDDGDREQVDSLAPPTPEAAKAQAGEVPADLRAQVDGYMRSFGAQYGDAFKFQGSVLVARDGELLYAGHFGAADITSGRAIGADTRFKIGNLTQQFTAVAILQLRDEGKLRLDDPVQRHLPDYPHKSVTIRHLLTHTSGIPSYTDALMGTGIKPNTRYEPAQIAAVFTRAALEFPPGSDFDPSNSGYFLLGMIIEAVGKQPLAEHMRARVFVPAGMTHTSVGDPGLAGAEPVATGYEFSEDELLVPVVAHDLSVYGAAAGMISTPADLLRWDQALRSPGRLLSAASQAEMFTPVRESYGLGWLVTRERGQTMVGHPGGVEGFNAAIARYLGDGVTVLALANTEAVDCRSVLESVAAIAHGEPVPPFAEHVEVPVSPAMFARYLGTFELTPSSRAHLAKSVDDVALEQMESVKIYDDGGRLFMLVPSHGAKWLHGLGEDRFFFKDHAGTIAQFGPPGAPVEWLRLWQGDLEFVLARSHAPQTPQAHVMPGK